MVLTTSLLAIKVFKEAYIPLIAKNSLLLPLDTFLLNTSPLKHMLNIYHMIYFKKDQARVKALLDFINEVNAMTSAYMAKLGFKI